MKKTYLSAAIAISLLLAGCGGKSAEEHYAAASALVGKQQYNEAIIELKSAVSAAPENADYRILLGRIYMQTGDFFSAEKELGKALENGAPLNEVALELIQSSYRAENYQAVLTPFKNESTLSESIQRYTAFYRTMTDIEMGVAEPSMATFDKLLEAPEADLQQFAKAIMQIKENNSKDALKLLETISETAPIDVEALLLRAQLKVTLAQTPEALVDFYDYLNRVPSALRTRLTVAQLQLKEQQLDKADEELKRILRFAPDHGFTNYLKAMIAFDQQEFNTAKEHIDKAIANRYNTTPARILAGLTYYRLGLNSQALAHLSNVQAQLGVYPPAQRLLTALQLQAGELTEAAGSLNSRTLTSDDITLAASTAFQLVRAGEARLANDIIKRIEDAGLTQDSRALTVLGQLKLGLPDQVGEALKNLEQALVLDPSRHDARLALAASYIRQKDFTKAAALGDEWLKKPETANAGYNLKAITSMLTGQMQEAERLLEQATLANAENPFTRYLSAALAQHNQESDKAITLLNETLELQPDYTPALLSLYGISKGLKHDVAPVISRIKETQKAFPQNQALHALLLNVYQQEQRNADIIAFLEPQLKTAENLGPNAYAILAGAYAAERQLPQALAITERWYKQDERNQQAALAHVNVLTLSNKHQEALTIVEQQLRRDTKNERLLLLKFALQAELNNHKDALETYAALPIEMANQPIVLFHKGRVQLNAGQISPGLATLQQSYDASPSPLTALAIAETQAKDISFQRATRFLEEHFDKHGRDDIRLYSFYGSLLIEADIQKAKVVYAEILEKQPDNPLILNNYAWILAASGTPKEAQPYAEKALTILPQNPDVIDTYGKIMKLQGDHKKAAELFLKSLAIRPAHAEVELNYAEALIQLNELSKAQDVLNNVSAQTAEQRSRLQQLKSNL